MELVFDAINYRNRFASEADWWELVFDVFDEASERYGVGVGWMPGIDRVERDAQASMALAEFAVAHRHRGVVSFGLHNDEVGHPPEQFVEPMRIAREGGLQITPHVGELDRGQHVETALDQLGATRILHGVRSVAALLDAGVRRSVNADDPLLVGASLVGEYELCRR